MRAINIFVEFVANEDRLNLKLPEEVVCGGEFDDVLMRDGDEGEGRSGI